MNLKTTDFERNSSGRTKIYSYWYTINAPIKGKATTVLKIYSIIMLKEIDVNDRNMRQQKQIDMYHLKGHNFTWRSFEDLTFF